MATKGLSLHIGLNEVDPDHYEGWDGALAACEFDAKDMQAIARKQGFISSMLLTEKATSANVIAGIQNAARSLKAGDMFWITYSGHGGQVPDTNGDEPDHQDETWVLYDRQLIDDELYSLWAKFKAGVCIAVLSDSCHSGSVVRAMPPLGLVARKGPRQRLLPPNLAVKVYREHKKLYNGIQKTVPAGDKVAVKSSVVLISGCQDNQTSLDGKRNGLFTEKLRKVWNNGKFRAGYQAMRDQVARLMPAEQTPNYYTAGAANPKFEARKPFTF